MNFMKGLLLISCFLITSFLMAGNHPDNPFKKEIQLNYSAPGYSKKIIEGGTYIHLQAMIPTKNYFLAYKGKTNDSLGKFGVGFGLEIGELFQLVESRSNNSLGLRMTILHAFYTSYSFKDSTVAHVLQGGILAFGPNLTIGFNDQSAIDIFYQFVPTYMFNTQDTTSYGASGAYAFLHQFGLGLRFNLLSFGASYTLGNGRYIDAPKNASIYKPRLDHFRIHVGLMF
jgi:hypothetical protein